ncbi:MAG: sigma-54-dependent Fis family transcriptional regulator [Desulfobacterales bacterium]|nr:sigma-54-dependent Fis family transcriptional regulator [Desulfobacterales bacterium]
MTVFKLFVIDDEESIRDAAQLFFGKDHEVTTFESAEAALTAMASRSPDLVLLDIGLPGMSGLEALMAIRRTDPDIKVIMITAYEDIETVVSAMRHGADDYVLKPFRMEILETSINNALEKIRLRKEIQILQESYLREHLPCFIGDSSTIQEVMDFVTAVAKSPDTPVLVSGETGTGKELIAKTIHYKSPNHAKAFVALNCAAIPEELIESELFGYEKGAFSGAGAAGKKGMIEEAAGGTLFLDEVGDLSLGAQAKLLRFLENGEYYRVGSSRKRCVNTRIVSATNRNLEEMIENSRFRRDLFHRLAVITVSVPSLNQRPEDIVPMAKFFLVEYGKKFNKPMGGFSPDAEDALRRHHWSGNVRELKNCIERAVLLGKGSELSLDDLGILGGILPPPACGPDGFSLPPLMPEGVDLGEIIASVEKAYFLEAIKISAQNASEAARHLGMNYYAFRRRREKLGL